MKIDSFSRVDIALHGDDIQTMREIVRLAYERIHSSEPVQLHGVPLTRQADLVGPELFRVKTAIEKIGLACGACLPYEPEFTQGASLVTTQHQAVSLDDEHFDLAQKVIVYDRFRFAIPVRGIVVGMSTSNDGVQIKLTETNNPNYPVGCDTVWVSRRQLRREGGEA